MTSNKNQQVLNLQVTDGLTVAIIKDANHEFLMSSNSVAKGYGVAASTLRSHKNHHKDELIENVHFVPSVQNLDGGNLTNTTILWTKAGVVRMGFFIRSERAKVFRDWAEQVVLAAISPQKLSVLPQVIKKKHNRLDAERLLDIVSDICLVEDKELRIRLLNKLMPETNLFTNPSTN
jgi:hypothetical protein